MPQARPDPHVPTLADVASTRNQRQFLAARKRFEAQVQRDLEALARARRWRFVANLHAHRAAVLEQHAAFLLSF